MRRRVLQWNVGLTYGLISSLGAGRSLRTTPSFLKQYSSLPKCDIFNNCEEKGIRCPGKYTSVEESMLTRSLSVWAAKTPKRSRDGQINTQDASDNRWIEREEDCERRRRFSSQWKRRQINRYTNKQAHGYECVAYHVLISDRHMATTQRQR